MDATLQPDPAAQLPSTRTRPRVRMSQTLARALAVPIGIYALPDAWMTRRNQQAVLLDHACPNDERQQHEDPYQEFADAAHGDSRRGGNMLYLT